MIVEELLVKLEADVKRYGADITNATKATAKNTGKMEKEFKELATTTKKSASGMSTAMATMAGVIGGQVVIGAFNAAKRGAESLFRTLVIDGVNAAQVQEDAVNDLNAALARTGKFTEEASIDFQAFAGSIQQASKFGDEAILTNAALIQSLGNLETDGLKKGTQAAVDMAAALRIDLKAAATLVGKAATGEISSFTRYGLAITKGKDAAETFANALTALNSKFGGAAAQQVNTFSGATAQLSNTWGDLTEEVGFAITKNTVVIDIIKTLESKIKSLTPAIAETARQLVNFLSPSTEVERTFDALEEAKTKLKDLQDQGFAGFFKADEAEIEKQQVLVAQLAAVHDAAISAKVQRDRMAAASDQEVTQSKVMQLETLTEAERVALEDSILTLEEDSALRTEILDARYETELQKLNDFHSQGKISLVQHQLGIKALNKKFDAEELKREQEKNKAMGALRMKELQAEVGIAQSTANLVGAIAGRESKAAFLLSRAAGIAQSIVSTNVAAAMALATPPGPPITAPLAAKVKLAGRLNTAAIAATTIQGLATGATSVQGFGTQDSVPALLTPRERVLTVDQNKDLTEYLKSQRQIAAAPQRMGGEIRITMDENAAQIIRAQFIQDDFLSISDAG